MGSGFCNLVKFGKYKIIFYSDYHHDHDYIQSLKECDSNPKKYG